jgi:hypothetical protein
MMTQRGAKAALWAAGVLGAILACPGRAGADGAFPDSYTIFAPADRPQELIVPTNFGVLISENNGGSWLWICEAAIAPLASRYQIGAPPNRSLYTISRLGLSTSHDSACTWAVAQGALNGGFVDDVFPDPTNPTRVMTLGIPDGDGGTAPMALFESVDQGATYGNKLYEAPMDAILTGVEIATTDPNTVYLTMTNGGPFVLRSTDRGRTWQTYDHTAELGQKTIRLIGIDKMDAHKLYLRIIDTPGDRLGISTDGGATIRVAATLATPMTTFMLRADGTMLLGTREGMGLSAGDVPDSEWHLRRADEHEANVLELGMRRGRTGDDVAGGRRADWSPRRVCAQARARSVPLQRLALGTSGDGAGAAARTRAGGG